jgi:hypothetical protein
LFGNLTIGCTWQQSNNKLAGLHAAQGTSVTGAAVQRLHSMHRSPPRPLFRCSGCINQLKHCRASCLPVVLTKATSRLIRDAYGIRQSEGFKLVLVPAMQSGQSPSNENGRHVLGEPKLDLCCSRSRETTVPAGPRGTDG